jgi:serine/threonine protein kinase
MAKAHFDLYKFGICHLDLKPENILLESNTQYVLCDLGCSRKLEQQANMNMSFNALKISTNARGGGTTEYGSPDLVINGEMTDFSDIWSLGVILYKIIYKKHPLMTLPSNYSQKLANFLKGDAKIDYPQN